MVISDVKLKDKGYEILLRNHVTAWDESSKEEITRAEIYFLKNLQTDEIKYILINENDEPITGFKELEGDLENDKNQVQNFISENCNIDVAESKLLVKNYFDDLIKLDDIKELYPSDHIIQDDDPNNSTWKGFKVPQMFTIMDDDNVVYKHVYNKSSEDYQPVPIIYTAAMLTGRGYNIDTDEEWVQVTFIKSSGREHNEWIKRSELLSKNGIIKLIGKGLGAIESEYKKCNEYFLKCELENSNYMREKIVSQKNGWKKDMSIFVWGCKAIDFNYKIHEVMVEDENAAKGLDKAGTLQEWVDGVKGIMQTDLTRFKLYNVATAPLLRVLSVQTYLIDNFGESGVGKTLSTDTAISAFGNPKELKWTGNSTQAATETLATMYTDLPLYLDETSTQQNEEILQSIGYMIANERGKGRMEKEGGLRETGQWKTVALTTGEKPFTSRRSFTGLKVRTLEIHGGLSLNGETELPEITQQAKSVIYENYGHLFEPFINKVYRDMDHIRDLFLKYRKHYSNATTGTGERIAERFAAIRVAADYIEEIFDDIGIPTKDPEDVIKEYYEETVQTTTIENYSIEALKSIYDQFQIKINQFINLDRDKIPQHDILGQYSYKPANVDFEQHGGDRSIQEHPNGYVDIYPEKIRSMLRDAGFESTRVLREWKQQDITETNKNRYDKTARILGHPTKLIRLKMHRIEEELGLNTEETEEVQKNNQDFGPVGTVYNILYDLSKNNSKKGISLDTLYKETAKHDLDSYETDKIIETMKKRGDIMKNGENYFKLIN